MKQKGVQMKKIQLLEDRSRITKGIEQLQAKEVTAEEVTAEEVKAEPTFAEENREDSDEVHSFADLHRKLAALPSFGPKGFGESACLQRLVAMHDDIASFVKEVRLREGLLSRAIVTGEKPQNNRWNEMMHELHLAAQGNTKDTEDHARAGSPHGWQCRKTCPAM